MMVKIAPSQSVRSSERARSALEAAGAGWLDASGCPVSHADFSLVCSDGAPAGLKTSHYLLIVSTRVQSY